MYGLPSALVRRGPGTAANMVGVMMPPALPACGRRAHAMELSHRSSGGKACARRSCRSSTLGGG
jgi:hypothetical protein